MRIVYLLTRADSVGGASVHVRDLAAAVRDRGHSVLVCLGGGGGPVADCLETKRVPWKLVPALRRPIHPLHDVRAWVAVAGELRHFRADLVSCHTSKAGAVGRLAAGVVGVPALYTPHCWSFADGFSGANFYLAIERLLAPATECYIAVSEWERSVALNKRLCPPNRIRVIHNGMENIASAVADPGAHPPRLVMVARFEKQKDHETLLRALAECLRDEWECDLIGDGPEQEHIELLVRKWGMSSRVHFLGACTDVGERLAQYQGMVLCSKWESFPRSILEGMRAGLPVIATDVGGVAEVVRDGCTGQLVRKGDVQGLGEVLRVFFRDGQRRRQWGQAGREDFEAKWGLDRMVRSTLELYNDVMGAGR